MPSISPNHQNLTSLDSLGAKSRGSIQSTAGDNLFTSLLQLAPSGVLNRSPQTELPQAESLDSRASTSSPDEQAAVAASESLPSQSPSQTPAETQDAAGDDASQESTTGSESNESDEASETNAVETETPVAVERNTESKSSSADDDEEADEQLEDLNLQVIAISGEEDAESTPEDQIEEAHSELGEERAAQGINSTATVETAEGEQNASNSAVTEVEGGAQQRSELAEANRTSVGETPGAEQSIDVESAGTVSAEEESGKSAAAKTDQPVTAEESLAAEKLAVRGEATADAAEEKSGFAATTTVVQVDSEAESAAKDAATPTQEAPPERQAVRDVAASEDLAGIEEEQAVPEESAQDESDAEPEEERSTKSRRSKRGDREPGTNRQSVDRNTPTVKEQLASPQQAAVRSAANVAPVASVEVAPETALAAEAAEVSNTNHQTPAPAETAAKQPGVVANSINSAPAGRNLPLSLRGEPRGASGQRITDSQQVRLIHRVAKAFQVAHQRDGEIRIRLSPPELGAVRLQIKVENSVMTARVEAETATARSLLVDNLGVLRQRLAEQNIRIDQFDVDLMESPTQGSPEQSRDQQDAQRQSPARPQHASRAIDTADSIEAETPASPISGKGGLNVVV